MDKPMTLEGRKARRENIRQDLLARAEQNALEVERSLKCSGRSMPYNTPRHVGEVDGCKNDGTTCICECHDPQVEVKEVGEDLTLDAEK